MVEIGLSLWSIVLGSVAIGAIAAAAINGFVNYRLKLAEIKEGRMRIALDLTRLKSEQVRAAAADYIEGAKLLQASGQAVPPRPELPSNGHRVPDGHRVVAVPILAGLHHEYRLEPKAA